MFPFFAFSGLAVVPDGEETADKGCGASPNNSSVKSGGGDVELHSNWDAFWIGFGIVFISSTFPRIIVCLADAWQEKRHRF
jgi:hypothetical protein